MIARFDPCTTVPPYTLGRQAARGTPIQASGALVPVDRHGGHARSMPWRASNVSRPWGLNRLGHVFRTAQALPCPCIRFSPRPARPSRCSSLQKEGPMPSRTLARARDRSRRVNIPMTGLPCFVRGLEAGDNRFSHRAPPRPPLQLVDAIFRRPGGGPSIDARTHQTPDRGLRATDGYPDPRRGVLRVLPSLRAQTRRLAGSPLAGLLVRHMSRKAWGQGP